MLEMLLVDQILKEYEDPEDCDRYEDSGDVPKSSIEKLREGMSDLLTMLQDEDKDPFQMAKNVVIVSHKILRARDENGLALTVEEREEFKVLALLFGTAKFLAIVSMLHNLSKRDDVCHGAMAEINLNFSGVCMNLASERAGSAKRVLRFNKENHEAPPAELKVMESKAELATEISQKVANLCLRYRS